MNPETKISINTQKPLPSDDMPRRVANLMLGILLILLFIFGIAPLMDRLPLVQPLVQFVDNREIDAGALYYTDIEEFATAAAHMENTRDYPPRDF